jgi:hypothetical protein
MSTIVFSQQTSYPVKAAEHIQQLIEMDQARLWQPDNFQGIPRKSILRKLAQLTDQGTLIRIRRGLYWYPDHNKKPDPLAVIQNICGSAGIGFSGLAAVDFLLSDKNDNQEFIEGLNYQPEIAVPMRPPRDLNYINCLFHNRSARKQRYLLKLTEYESSLLEALQQPELIDDSDFFVKSIKRLIKQDKIDLNKLSKASFTEPAIVRGGLINLLFLLGEDNSASQIKPIYSDRALNEAWNLPSK